MRIAIALSLVALIPGFYLAGLSGARAEQDAVDVGTVFSRNCAKCHEVPDATLPMDLVWLDQVNRTT